ncbi:MAG: outer membrane beta-barrel protein [Verrucomicrobiota bacterium]
MKLYLLPLSFITLIASVCSAGTYVGAGIGALTDGGDLVYTARLGYDFTDDSDDASIVGLELEYLFTSGDESLLGATADTDFSFIMANFRYEMALAPTPTDLYLYTFAGIGFAMVDVDTFFPGLGQDSDDDTTFAAQGGIGLKYLFSESFSVLFGYRYLYLDETEFELYGLPLEPGSEGDSIIELGFNYSF